ncbi:hypothetical protein H4S08_004109, partial [Coemansia sp. RSA 1365]
MHTKFSNRQICWLEMWQAFDMLLKYHAGSKNDVADGLLCSQILQLYICSDKYNQAVILQPMPALQMPDASTFTSESAANAAPPQTSGSAANAASPQSSVPAANAAPPQPVTPVANAEPSQTTTPAAETASPLPAPPTTPPNDIEDLLSAFDGLNISSVFTDPADSSTMEVQLLHDHAQMPIKAHQDDAGFGIHCIDNISLDAYQLIIVSTGVAARAPLGSYLQTAPCSSLTSKGIEVLSGIVNRNYNGEIKILLFNSSRANIAIAIGNRIAQIIPMMIAHP